MSSAFYPLGMNTYNNRLPQGGYKPQKGTGAFSNPVGITAGNIRPLTNKDPLNSAPAPFGKARPLKHYRRGINIPVENNAGSQFYANREVKSSVQDKMVQQMLDNPGRYIVKQNKNPDYAYVGNLGENTKRAELDFSAGGEAITAESCNSCRGVAITTDYKPVNSLTERPQPNPANPFTCCNQQLKATRRAIYASTNLKKNYYTNTYQYLFNRCQTYDQRVFNFKTGYLDPALEQQYPEEVKYAKPGSALAYPNYYVANCNPNSIIQNSAEIAFVQSLSLLLLNRGIITQEQYNEFVNSGITGLVDFVNFLKTNLEAEKLAIALGIVDEAMVHSYDGALISGVSKPRGCARVYYKPNNPQFATQGAVDSSTRTLKVDVDTITTNAASVRNTFFKNKAPTCNPAYYIKNGNPKTCFRNTNDM